MISKLLGKKFYSELIELRSVLDMKRLYWFIGVWAFMLIFVNVVLSLGYNLDAPRLFPFSQLTMNLSISGLPYVGLFLVTLYYLVNRVQHFNLFQLWLACTTMLVLGNLVQGGFTEAFANPFTVGDQQYYHDAIKIESWTAWLANFNENQLELLLHTKTHPPFAVLIHYWVLKVLEKPIFMGVFFSLIFSSTFLALFKILLFKRVETKKANLLVFLFAILPAVNIYGIVCLDALIACMATWYLYCLLKLTNGASRNLFKYSIYSSLLLTFLLLLSYISIYFIITSVIYAFYISVKGKNYRLLILLFSTITASALILSLVSLNTDYNYIRSLLVASKSENPNGFYLFENPLNYFVTRVECIIEIGVMLSVSTFFKFSKSRSSITAYNIEHFYLLFLVIFLFLGTFRTGEAARVTLFIIPIFVLLISKVRKPILITIIKITAIHTTLFGFFGDFFW